MAALHLVKSAQHSPRQPRRVPHIRLSQQHTTRAHRLGRIAPPDPVPAPAIDLPLSSSFLTPAGTSSREEELSSPRRRGYVEKVRRGRRKGSWYRQHTHLTLLLRSSACWLWGRVTGIWQRVVSAQRVCTAHAADAAYACMCVCLQVLDEVGDDAAIYSPLARGASVLSDRGYFSPGATPRATSSPAVCGSPALCGSPTQRHGRWDPQAADEAGASASPW